MPLPWQTADDGSRPRLTPVAALLAALLLAACDLADERVADAGGEAADEAAERVDALEDEIDEGALDALPPDRPMSELAPGPW